MTRSTLELVVLALGWRPNERSTFRARALLDQVGGVRGLLAADGPGLVAAGLSERQAERLVAVVELVRRREEGVSPTIPTPEDVERLVGDELRLATEERLLVLCLDRRHRVIAKVTATVGSAAFTIVDAAQVYGIALRHGAAAVILVHNHPSGDPTPSQQDLEVTRRVAGAGRVLGVPLLDHVVVGAERVVSLAQLGEVPVTCPAQATWAA